jgi:MFS family permease
VHVLVAARAVNRLGAFTLPFLAVTLVRELDASIVQAGYLLAAFGLATVPSRLFGGHLADRVGGRATIVGGLVGTAAAQLLVAAAPSLPVAAVAVVLLGLAFEVYEPPSQALVADLTPEDRRPAAYGLMAGAMAAAGMAAGLLALALAGVGLRWLFVVDAATCLACALLVRLALPRGTTAPAPSTGRAWHDPRLLTMLGAGTVFAVVYLQIMLALPLTVTARGHGASLVGVLLTVSAATMVLGQPLLAHRRVRAVDDFTAMAVGYLLLGAGLLVTGLVHTLPGYVAATVAWSVGDLVLLGRAYTVVAALAPAGSRGGYLATYGTSWGVAAVLAPLLGTRLLALGGPPLAWSVLAALCLVLAVAQPVVRRVVSGGSHSRLVEPVKTTPGST